MKTVLFCHFMSIRSSFAHFNITYVLMLHFRTYARAALTHCAAYLAQNAEYAVVQDAPAKASERKQNYEKHNWPVKWPKSPLLICIFSILSNENSYNFSMV